MNKPLKELLELYDHAHSAEEGDGWGYEMARRLRKLDEWAITGGSDECDAGCMSQADEWCLHCVAVREARHILEGGEK